MHYIMHKQPLSYQIPYQDVVLNAYCIPTVDLIHPMTSLYYFDLCLFFTHHVLSRPPYHKVRLF